MQDETRSDQEPQESTDGPGNISVDEPTDTSLEPHNDEAFRGGVPEPGQGKSDSSEG